MELFGTKGAIVSTQGHPKRGSTTNPTFELRDSEFLSLIQQLIAYLVLHSFLTIQLSETLAAPWCRWKTQLQHNLTVMVHVKHPALMLTSRNKRAPCHLKTRRKLFTAYVGSSETTYISELPSGISSIRLSKTGDPPYTP